MPKHPLRTLLRISLALTALLVLTYLAQRPFRAAEPPAQFEWLAHRGVHQTYHREGLTNETCTATRIDPPRHDYLENTLPSIRAALDAGATMVEMDVHRTVDGHVVVWHDWTVDCRTEGSGETRTLTLAQLKALDAGYGYTADGGRSFPFRGRFVGVIPTLDEVLTAFPAARFVINQKDRSPTTTAAIAEVVDRHLAGARACLMGRKESNAQYLAAPGGPRCALSGGNEIKTCLLDYLAQGWTGHWPANCRGTTVMVPDSPMVRLLWGWPGTFIERARANGSKVYAFTDDPERALHLRALGVDGVMSDRIELMPMR